MYWQRYQSYAPTDISPWRRKVTSHVQDEDELREFITLEGLERTPRSNEKMLPLWPGVLWTLIGSNRVSPPPVSSSLLGRWPYPAADSWASHDCYSLQTVWTASGQLSSEEQLVLNHQSEAAQIAIHSAVQAPESTCGAVRKLSSVCIGWAVAMFRSFTHLFNTHTSTAISHKPQRTDTSDNCTSPHLQISLWWSYSGKLDDLTATL